MLFFFRAYQVAIRPAKPSQWQQAEQVPLSVLRDVSDRNVTLMNSNTICKQTLRQADMHDVRSVCKQVMRCFHAAGLLEERVFKECQRGKRRNGDPTFVLCLQSGDSCMQLSDTQLYSRCMHTTQRLQTLARQKELPVLEYVQTHADQVDAVIQHCFQSSEPDVLAVQGPFFSMPDGSYVCSLCLGDKYTVLEQQGATMLPLLQSICNVHHRLPSLLKHMHQQTLAGRRVAIRIKK
jgi:hypothetical protein